MRRCIEVERSRRPDTASGMPVAVVNQQFATVSWPGEDPVGKRLRLFRGDSPGSWLTVVGVVSNIVQDDRTGQRIDPVSLQAVSAGTRHNLVGARANTRAVERVSRLCSHRTIEAIDGDIMVGPGNSGIASPLDELLKNGLTARMKSTACCFSFSRRSRSSLASAGLYAVVAHSVSQRTQEIGIRSARPAGRQRRDILTLVMKVECSP